MAGETQMTRTPSMKLTGADKIAPVIGGISNHGKNQLIDLLDDPMAQGIARGNK